MLVYLKAILFAMVLYNAGEVPLQYGYTVYLIAQKHQVNEIEMGAILLAENTGNRYHPMTVGRYGGGGEYGLYQLHPNTWGSFCKRKDPNLLVKFTDLFDPSINIECAAHAIAYMQKTHEDNCLNKYKSVDPSWIHHYRCGSSVNARNSNNCFYSVKRVQKEIDKITSLQEVNWIIALSYLTIPFPKLIHKSVVAHDHTLYVRDLIASPRKMKAKMKEIESKIFAWKEKQRDLMYQKELSEAQKRKSEEVENN